MIFLFWFCLSLILYCYLGYPLILAQVSRWHYRPINKEAITPGVSIVLSVWNERDVIDRKIKNLLALDYPSSQMEILIGSDGSDDGTTEIIRSFKDPRVHLFVSDQRRGKMATLNDLVSKAKFDVIVFNDARQEIEPVALRKLVSNLADPRVGCVSGELIFRNKEGVTAKGINLYWEYEKFMRNHEARIHSMLGATGALYAIHKKLYTPVPTDVVLDDMYIPLRIIEKGFRAVFESEARAYDDPAQNPREEYRRKTRTLYGNFQIFQYFIHLFNPWTSPVAVQFFSHKFLRVVVPFLMVGLFLINLVLLKNDFFWWVLIAQIVFYAMALCGAWARRSDGKTYYYLGRLCYIPYVFCLLNFSVFVGLWRFMRRDQKVTWEKARKV